MNYFWIGLVFGSVVILIYISTIGIKNIVRYNRISLEYDALSKEYKNVSEKQSFFNDQISSLTEPVHLEFLAKKRLGYVKKNERVIKFIQEW